MARMKGQRFTGLPADTWNKMSAFVNGQKTGNTFEANKNLIDNGIVPIKNNTGIDLAQFAIVGFTDELFSPNNENQLDAFKNYRSLKGIIPNLAVGHTEKYGIVQAPCKAGDIVPCMMSGYTPVSLKVNKDWHKYAVPVDGSTANMETASNGTATVVWASASEGGTGLAFVTLRDSIPYILFGEAKTNWNDAEDDGCYVNVYPCENLAGDNKDTDSEIKVWLPRGNIEQDPNIVAEDILMFQMSDMTTTPLEAIAISHYLDGKIDTSYQLIVSGEDVPDGWQKESEADQRTVVFNSDAPETGYATHGASENSHSTHPTPRAYPPTGQTVLEDFDGDPVSVGGTGSATVSGWDGTHSTTSNWPPWFKIDIIKRIDNSN